MLVNSSSSSLSHTYISCCQILCHSAGQRACTVRGQEFYSGLSVLFASGLVGWAQCEDCSKIKTTVVVEHQDNGWRETQKVITLQKLILFKHWLSARRGSTALMNWALIHQRPMSITCTPYTHAQTHTHPSITSLLRYSISPLSIIF